MGLLKVDRQYQVGEYAFQNSGGAIGLYDFGTIIPGFCLVDQCIGTVKDDFTDTAGTSEVAFGLIVRTATVVNFLPLTLPVVATTIPVNSSVNILATQPNNLVYILNNPAAIFSFGMAISVAPLTGGRLICNLGYNRTDL